MNSNPGKNPITQEHSYQNTKQWPGKKKQIVKLLKHKNFTFLFLLRPKQAHESSLAQGQRRARDTMCKTMNLETCQVQVILTEKASRTNRDSTYLEQRPTALSTSQSSQVRIHCALLTRQQVWAGTKDLHSSKGSAMLTS